MNEIEIKKPKGFLWMDEWAELTADLTNEQLGILLKAAQNFHLGNDYDIGDDKELKMAFRFISNCIKQNDDKYDKACKAKKEAREKQIKQQQERNNKKKDNPAYPSISQDMPTNADYQNTNTNQNENTNTNQNQNQNINTIPLKGGEGDTPAPAREDFLETFGLLHNVKMAPEQHRHLVEDYGQEATDATIDDLSCKLADGTVDSSNHYATLLSWLRYQRRNGGTATMSSTQAVPTYIPPKEPEFTPREQAIIDDFNAWKAKNPDLRGVYDLLSQLAAKHGGIPDKVCRALGMKYYAKSWHF